MTKPHKLTTSAFWTTPKAWCPKVQDFLQPYLGHCRHCAKRIKP